MSITKTRRKDVKRMSDVILSTCVVCGAAIAVLPGEERPSQNERLHVEWHYKFTAALETVMEEVRGENVGGGDFEAEVERLLSAAGSPQTHHEHDD